ncbi:hypothetical protein [Kocuria sp. SM24M-10]|uniref:hypothetical protein n=1 Tax=Kocuria sp. SM24M-10 TaxID=1660349 RepID=UPI00064950E1|nr:hypothetical protein [Kocuria sp. SM24M-10]KLU08490.1 hypothetical protein ABL57_17840 [Kocuria sp. SM24M-10]
MADLFDFNHGGATRPGARAIVHPGADSGEHMVRYHVVTETKDCITLDDGYTYDKRTGVVQGPGGRPTLQNRVVVTEGSVMFASWSHTARTPHRSHRRSTPGGAMGPLRASRRATRALLRFLGRR